jgi:hypothetical protein
MRFGRILRVIAPNAFGSISNESNLEVFAPLLTMALQLEFFWVIQQWQSIYVFLHLWQWVCHWVCLSIDTVARWAGPDPKSLSPLIFFLAHSLASPSHMPISEVDLVIPDFLPTVLRCTFGHFGWCFILGEYATPSLICCCVLCSLLAIYLLKFTVKVWPSQRIEWVLINKCVCCLRSEILLLWD